uniref:Ig-like domain-containing protein n=1 Tax=Myripristis murdjan TaxID=586833 RepID=A0A667ZMR7_9TELE
NEATCVIYSRELATLLETKQNKKKTTSLSLKLYFSPGQSQLIGPPQPIVAIVGDDIVLPCHLDPAVDAFDMIVEWTRPDLDHRLVLLWRHGWELEHKNHLSYEGRTSLFMEKLKNGDVSLKLSEVKLSDEGKYRCFIPSLDRESIVELVVEALDSTPCGLLVLECESKGWYPEPELFWLDAEGKLLSAGAPETVRGPDGLYTVSSRVTVEKSHNNSFTCRVQQLNFFFVYIYDSPALYVAIVFAVIFVFMSILAVLFRLVAPSMLVCLLLLHVLLFPFYCFFIYYYYYYYYYLMFSDFLWLSCVSCHSRMTECLCL